MNKTGLLVIDVQPVFMAPEPMWTRDGDDLVAKCAALIDRARQADVPVLFVRHIGESGQYAGDDPRFGIHPGLALSRGEPVVEKRFGSAFMETDLEAVLRGRGIGRLVVCGLATDGCVNATVLHARCLGYDVTVVADAHATSGSPDVIPAEIVAAFNAAWERIGVTVVPAAKLTL